VSNRPWQIWIDTGGTFTDCVALSPFQGLLRRSQTSATDAYLGPVISGYLQAVQDELGDKGASLLVMTSAGGLVDADNYRAMDSLLSGPAGGVVGAATAGWKAGLDKVIAFDMGGTSTDVSRFDGDFEYVFEHQVGPVKLAAPALAIETVAAGGGSICRVEQGRLAEAIRHISVRKGIDPAGYSLVAFGGAGGQHACRVAELLGMEEVILPGDAGLLSAMGLGHAVIERFAQREVLRPLEGIGSRIEGWLKELEDEAADALAREGIDRGAIDRPRRIVELRYLGQDAALEIEPPSAARAP
jgi:N-methylhydantoinase A/oxoprolinase/acetone carboxylase beta subunit